MRWGILVVALVAFLLWRFRAGRRRRTFDALTVGVRELGKVMGATYLDREPPRLAGHVGSRLVFETATERFAIDANALTRIIALAPREQWHGKLRFLLANAPPVAADDLIAWPGA